MQDYMQAANDPRLWFVTIPVISIVVIQAILFIRNAWTNANTVGLTTKECKKAFNVGVISSLGPSFGVVTVMLGMIAILGTPITWQRLSMVGNAQQEMMMAEIGAGLYNTKVGGVGYGMEQFAASVWMQTLHGCNWMIAVWLVLHKMENVSTSLSKRDTNLLPIIGAAALAGVIAMLSVSQAKASSGNTISLIIAAISMFVFSQLGEKSPVFKKLKEYGVGISMLIAMLLTRAIIGA